MPWNTASLRAIPSRVLAIVSSDRVSWSRLVSAMKVSRSSAL